MKIPFVLVARVSVTGQPKLVNRLINVCSSRAHTITNQLLKALVKAPALTHTKGHLSLHTALGSHLVMYKSRSQINKASSIIPVVMYFLVDTLFNRFCVFQLNLRVNTFQTIVLEPAHTINNNSSNTNNNK